VSEARGVDDAPAEGPGPSLTRGREALGLTEQQAAEQLNLDVSVVYALESGDLASLGAPVFARGHLKRYGAMLGLPEDELLAAYERARTQPEQPSLVPHSRQEMSPTRDRRAWPWALGGALLFLLAAGLIAYVSQFGFALPSREGDSSQGTLSGGNEATSVMLDASGPGAGEDSGALTDGAVSTAGPARSNAGGAGATVATQDQGAPATTAQELAPGQVAVSLSFAADSWAEIYDSAGKAVFYDLGRAGSSRSFTATAPLSVTLGNAPAVTLTVNGRATALPPIPAGQTVARFKIQPDGTLD
jgi:cytoskeleton protein RodZ